MRSLEKHVMLSVVDNAWKEHLASMDYLRQGIYLRGYAQKQPKQEFKRESFELFSEMLDRIKTSTNFGYNIFATNSPFWEERIRSIAPSTRH